MGTTDRNVRMSALNARSNISGAIGAQGAGATAHPTSSTRKTAAHVTGPTPSKETVPDTSTAEAGPPSCLPARRASSTTTSASPAPSLGRPNVPERTSYKK